MSHTHQLLMTKLAMPAAQPWLVSRSRLLTRLAQGRSRLTLLCAPAGFGKSALLSDWLHTSHQSSHASDITWLILDEADNDPLCFWTYVGTALQRLDPHVGTTLLQGLQTPHPPLEALLTTLLNELLTFREQVTLVLEDYHVIHTLSIHQTLSFLFEHLPPQMHLVIATRSDPPLPLARLRARGELCELRAEEVLSRQSLSIQEFLLQTSILTRLNGSLANAILEREDGKTLLEQVRQANLFLIPLDQERRWYRYHQLFADLLRVRLEETHPELVPVLYQRTIAWYKQQSRLPEAIQYALAGKLFEEAADSDNSLTQPFDTSV